MLGGVTQKEGTAENLHAAIQNVVDSPEWVTNLPQAQDEGATQLFVVAGLCLDEEHAEGCGQTPVGVYHFNAAFGIAADPFSL
ncbi:MAG: hypothetical protein IJ048_07615 [Clostridia bacterium]|nr:hypothetical protein [Clostridia bacterium]